MNCSDLKTVRADQSLTPEEVQRWVNKGRQVAEAERQLETGRSADGKPLSDADLEDLRNETNKTKNGEVNFTDATRRNIFNYAYYQRQREQLNTDRRLLDDHDPRRGDLDQDIHGVDQQLDAQMTTEAQEETVHLTREAELIETIQKEERAVKRGEAKLAQAEADGVDGFRLGIIKRDLKSDQEEVLIWRNFLRKFRQRYGTRFPDYQLPEEQSQEGSGSDSSHSMGDKSNARNVPLSGQANVFGGEGSFRLQLTGGIRLQDETPENFLGNQKLSEGPGTSGELKKTWSVTDSQSSLFLELERGETFNVNYAVNSQEVSEEFTVFVTSGYENFLDEWSTVMPRNYAGLEFENIQLTVDVTPTFITSLIPGINPWEFQQTAIQQGFDLSRWEGSELPIGPYLQWAVDEQTFGRFTQQNGSSIQFSEHDAATNIAPVPAWNSRDWPSSAEGNPLPYLKFNH